MRVISKLIFLLFLIYTSTCTLLASNSKDYVEQQLMRINEIISKGKFVKGELYYLNDTIKTDILLFNKKERRNLYLFCIIKSEKDSINIIRVDEIIGYKILDDIYIRHKQKEDQFFIKKIKSGKIDLYQKLSFPFDNQFLYYLKLPSFENYIVINPSKNDFSMDEIADIRKGYPNRLFLLSNKHEEVFKEFVSKYLGDCISVQNMVKTGFSTINDIPSIIDNYNKCF